MRGRKAAAGIKRLAVRPDLVLASPLLRAHQTAQLLERHARWPSAQACPELAPEATPRALLELLGRSAAPCIAIVGHEPHLGALLGQCLPGAPGEGFAFRKMGAALVRFRGRVRLGRGQLVWFAPPRLLRAVQTARPR